MTNTVTNLEAKLNAATTDIERAEVSLDLAVEMLKANPSRPVARLVELLAIELVEVSA